MPITFALTGNLTGLSTIGGQVGPASFNYPLNAAGNFETKEIPVAANMVSTVFTFPTISSQTLFYLLTTQDVTLTINSEPSGTLKAGGVLIRCGMAPVTQITLAGNTLTSGVVYVVSAGA